MMKNPSAVATLPRWTLGRRLMLTVVVGAVAPLLAIGAWTTRNAAHSGELLLRAQLDSTLTAVVRDIEERWETHLSNLLFLTGNEPVRLALTDSLGTGRSNGEPPAFVQRAFAATSGIERVTLRDRADRLQWTLERVGEPGSLSANMDDGTREAGLPVERLITVAVPVTDLTTGDTIGALEAQIRATLLLPSLANQESAGGTLTAIFFGERGALLPPASDEGTFGPAGRDRAGNRWMSARTRLSSPEIEVVVAAMSDPFIVPFQRSARGATIGLFGAALFIVVVVIVLLRRITHELERVVLAAEAVAAGNLDLRLPVHSEDEVGRIATAFNAMTASLSNTMRQLSQKEALAAVGEFATELSHEIRNPLTSIRLDLQRVEELAGDAAAVRGIVPRLLRQIGRLDRAVTGALRVARGGRPSIAAVNIAHVLQAAELVAQPEFTARGTSLVVERLPGQAIELVGDAEALEQVFINLLINAAHALQPNGVARVRVEREHESIVVTVADEGAGMSEQQLNNLRLPFRSTKRDGTGLGLKIARRIVEAHQGRMDVQSVLGGGTTVKVILPGPRSVLRRPEIATTP